jgi:hypothetical protein
MKKKYIMRTKKFFFRKGEVVVLRERLCTDNEELFGGVGGIPVELPNEFRSAVFDFFLFRFSAGQKKKKRGKRNSSHPLSPPQIKNLMGKQTLSLVVDVEPSTEQAFRGTTLFEYDEVEKGNYQNIKVFLRIGVHANPAAPKPFSFNSACHVNGDFFTAMYDTL